MDSVINASKVAWIALRDIVLDDEDQRKKVSRALGITYFKIKVIIKISDRTVSVSDLVIVLASDKTYISMILRDLEEDGTIERVQSPFDRRFKTLVLTSSGKSIAKKSQEIIDHPPEGFSNLTDKDISNLFYLIGKISSN